MQNWFARFSQQLGGWPDNYLVWDLESTGLSKDKDLILEFGFCLVCDREASVQGNLILDWTRPDCGVPIIWLREKLEATKYHMEKKGLVYPFTLEYLHEHGIHPFEGLKEIGDLIDTQTAQDVSVVLHNGLNFDIPMLQKHFEDYLGCRWEAGATQILDTGCIEKASQLGRLAQPGDDLPKFMGRMCRTGGRTKWSLWDHCVPRYLLERRYQLDLKNAHRASYDAWTTHLLFEEYRRIGLSPQTLEEYLQELVA